MECRSSSLAGCWCRAPWLWWCWSWWWWWPRCCCCTSPHSRFIFNPCSAHWGLFLTNLFLFRKAQKSEAIDAGELCCWAGGAGTLLSPAASGVANIRSPGPSSSSRPITELATSSCRPFSQSERVKQLLLCGGLENALPGLVFHHQPSDGFHPSFPACTKDPAFALFSSGWLAPCHLL